MKYCVQKQNIALNRNYSHTVRWYRVLNAGNSAESILTLWQRVKDSQYRNKITLYGIGGGQKIPRKKKRVHTEEKLDVILD
jgi:hypothetical protein